MSLFLFSEMALRYAERRLSKDIEHIRATAALSAEIRSDRENLPDEVLQVLFIGNSSIRAGINPEQLERELRLEYGMNVRSYFFYPDGGNVNSWRWAWRRYFHEQEAFPDWVVLCGGRSHFDDARLDARAAAQYFVSDDDVSTYLQQSGYGFEERLAFIAAKESVSYASRGRVQRRVLDLIMPYNREVLFEMTMPSDHSGAKPITDSRPRFSVNLEALLSEIKEKGPKVAVALVPNSEPYNLTSRQSEVIHNVGARLFDFREVPGIKSENFYDHAHLDKDGAKIFTAALAKGIAESVVGR